MMNVAISLTPVRAYISFSLLLLFSGVATPSSGGEQNTAVSLPSLEDTELYISLTSPLLFSGMESPPSGGKQNIESSHVRWNRISRYRIGDDWTAGHVTADVPV